MHIDRLDHIVLTVADLDATTDFYTRVLGLRAETFGERRALHFGANKINLHRLGHEFEPKAGRATAGSADLCFITDDPIDAVLAELVAAGVTVEVGPVPRTGATGAMTSCYFRDPDDNLIEIARYDP